MHLSRIGVRIAKFGPFSASGFQHRLEVCLCAGDFSLMTQYRSHTPDTLAYMERYLLTFHKTKNIFLEFHTSKSTRAEVHRQDRELRRLMVNQIAQEAHHISAAQHRRQADQKRLERVTRWAE